MKAMTSAATPAFEEPAWKLYSPHCSLHVEKLKPCLLLLTVDGHAPDDFEMPLLEHIHACCRDAYQLDMLIDLEKATRFPVTTSAWVTFINENASVFKRIFILATSKENLLAVEVASHLVTRQDVIIVIKGRILFDAWRARLLND